MNIDLLVRGCTHVYTEQELAARLRAAQESGRPLRVKLGMDPTAPDIHLGHSVVLQKLRQFQDLGHKALLVIGDFTALIGDPTGRSKTRPVLTPEEVEANAATYLAQAGKILDMGPERLEIRRNSEWLSPMNFASVIVLASRMTVGQLLKRDDFRRRFESETPIGIHELLYPLVQGWDSVQIEADVELGGTDQTYNNLVGRELQSQVGQTPQVVMTLPLLRGLDGEKKMSKSTGNYIALHDPPTQVFGKTMSIPDSLLEEWFSLLTDLPEHEWRAAIQKHPRDAKALLARTIGTKLHGEDAMREAEAWWIAHFSQSRNDEPIDVLVPDEERVEGVVPAWKLCWLAHGRALSRSEARRMVEGGAFEFNGQKITDPNHALAVQAGHTFRAGRFRSGERIKQPLIARVVLG